MRFFTMAAAVTLVLSGCATVNKQALSQEAKSGLQGQTITYTTRAKPDFAAMTATKGAFALIGAVAAISEGNSLIAKHNVPDPAGTIALGLTEALQQSHSMRFTSSSISTKTDNASQIATDASGRSAYVIDAQTINWSFVYFPTNWTHYRVIYTAKVRLINANTKSVVAEGFCKRIPDSDVGAPTYDELLSADAAGLKKELNIAAQECINSMKTEMLSI
ncbi:hypothetical protein [Pseudogulbenkiania sp. MAI-1]|uniref:hypothetical protein n=1 Tax=Pseudogulbenkiania sp. MAI-1 TaxID=990370 RepID=UPI0012EC48BF|nr:hypothetical protein [Pseudogulbenkiania sp. MAI-1]